MIKIELIDKKEIPTVFPLVKDDLSRAFEYLNGRFRERDIFDSLISGDMSLILVYEDNKIGLNLITLFTQYPSKKVMTVMSMSGSNFDYWGEELDKFLVNHAKENQCDIIEGVARLGMIKKLSGLGYSGELCILEKGI